MIEYQYSLDTPDPITRLGIHGLYRALQYPRNPLPVDLTFVPDASSFTVKTTPEALYQFVCESMTPDDNHLVIPPGYEKNPSRPRFVASAIAHRALTSCFFAKKSPKVSVSKSKTPRVPLSSYLTLKDASIRWVGRWNDKGEPSLTVTCSPASLRGYNDKGTTPCQGDKFDPQRLDASITTSSAWHPVFGTWNNHKCEDLSIQEALATYFIPWGYVWFRVLPEDQEKPYVEVAGFGLDLPSFAAASTVHKRINVGEWVTDVYAGVEVGLLTALASCRLPLDRPYSVIQGNTHRWLNPQGCLDHQMAEAFATTLEEDEVKVKPDEVKPDDVLMAQSNKKLRVLRSVQTFWQGRQQSLHDIVYQNLTRGAVWYAGLGSLVSYGSKYKDMKKDSNWECKMAKALGTMNVLLSKDDEQLMVRMAAKAKWKIHKDLGTGDYDKSSAVIKNALRGATGRDALRRAWVNVICVDPNHNFKMSEQEVKVFLAFLDSNPQQLRDLLLLGNAMILSKED